MNLKDFYLSIFVFLLFLVITDNSISKYIKYSTDIFRYKFFKFKWWILNNPKNPIVKYMMYRRAMYLAKKLKKELER